MNRPLIIQVGIPSYSGKLFPETWETVKALSAYEGTVSFNVFIVPQCYSSAEGRNYAVSLKNRLKKQTFAFDYFLSMDADNSFDVSQILMLLDRDKDIISAAYPIRRSALGKTINRLVASNWKNGQPGIAGTENYISDTVRGLHRVDMVGLGCCLIRKKVFESMIYPYFRNNVIDEIRDGIEYSGLGSDDVSFSVNVAKYGYSIFLDADVIVNHHCGNEAR